MIIRQLSSALIQRFFKQKVIILLGPRQSGKTTLLHYITQNQPIKSMILNADEADIRSLLTETTSTRLKTLIGESKLVCIDEAQRIQNIGLTLKLFTDMIKDAQVIASGSSSFDLANITAEPLTPSAEVATLIGAIGGALVVFSIIALDKLRIDDPVGAISVHGVSGFWGLLAVAITNEGASFFTQLLGAAIIFAWVFAASFITWLRELSFRLFLSLPTVPTISQLSIHYI